MRKREAEESRKEEEARKKREEEEKNKTKDEAYARVVIDQRMKQK